MSWQNILGYGAVRGLDTVTKRSLWGYRGDDWVSFLKLTITDRKSLPKVRDMSFSTCSSHSSLTPVCCLYAYSSGGSADSEVFSNLK